MKISSPSRLILTPTATKLLADRTYDMEFHGYLSNHAKHAIIALDRLQAPEERVQEYWNFYTGMTPYNLQLHKVDKDWDTVIPATLEQWNEWRGKKIHWQEQAKFVYQQLLGENNGDTNTLVKSLAPEIIHSPSLAGALTHGIIHLGWAIDAQSPWMIAEGLAYLNFSAVGVDPKKIKMDQHSDATPMESLIRVAETFHNENLTEKWIQYVKDKYDADSFHPELVPSGFQWEMAKVFEEAHAVATGMPTWITTKHISKLYEELYRTITYLYLTTRDENGHGNFLLLHMITSLWALEHTLDVVEDASEREAKESLTRGAIAQWFANLICFASAGGGGFPPVSALQEIQCGQFDAMKNDPTDLDWSNVVDLALKETEEHNIKLVYVSRELWSRYGNWHGFFAAANSFTTTPDIGPDTPKYDG